MLNVTLFIPYRLREQMGGCLNRCPSFSCGAVYGRSQEMITDLPRLMQLLNHRTGQHKECPTDLCRDCWTNLITQKIHHSAHKLIRPNHLPTSKPRCTKPVLQRNKDDR